MYDWAMLRQFRWWPHHYGSGNMSEGKIGKQPPATGELGVQITRRPHLEGCPALSGDNPCGCYENAIPNLIPDDVSPDERTMRIGYPGHFYRRPFFAVSVE
jgi:hypothetical protein